MDNNLQQSSHTGSNIAQVLPADTGYRVGSATAMGVRHLPVHGGFAADGAHPQ